MENLKKTIKMILISIASLILLLILAITLFLNFYPSIGTTPSKKQAQEYSKLENYRDGQFRNAKDPVMNINLKTMIEFFKGDPSRAPQEETPVLKLDSLEIEKFNNDSTRLTWFGHSAFLLEIDGLKILLDPMLGPVPAPHPWLGTKRYQDEIPLEIDKLPKIDAVFFSHDHYDHLDYLTIKKIKSKVDMFFVPLGIANHLQGWGVDESKIQEFNWWEGTEYKNLKLTSTPAQHFSGRGLFDRGKTLWCSWVIQGKKDNIYFSGDGGYGDHFKEIGEKLGPFDFAMMECGQYNKDWADIHMMPEETAQAAKDIKADRFMPIHWGSFTLSLHPWKDPIERVTKKAKELKLNIATPRIGESIFIQSNANYVNWWEGIN